MKKNFFKSPLYTIFAVSFMLGNVGCSDSDDPFDGDDEKDKLFSQIITQFVNNTVIATYHSLSEATIDLYEALDALKKEKTDANVEAAVKEWINARNYWEYSEAFLFGPAVDFGIDPHIDTWPLDINELRKVLSNESQINSMDSEEGDIYAGKLLGPNVLGFHAIEYIIFEKGRAREASSISDLELIYAVAVAGDLRNQCFRLEAAWAGFDNVSKEKQEKLEDMEEAYTLINGNSYGTNMLNAGQAGSTHRSKLDACQTILEGCMTIADEVGAMKIGMPHKGEDPNYIESPYSYNSITDFYGNIQGVKNSYLGGVDASKRGASVSDYIKQVNSKLDTEVRDAIEDALNKIEDMPAPFVDNTQSAKAGLAMDACNYLAEILAEAKQALAD